VPKGRLLVRKTRDQKRLESVKGKPIKQVLIDALEQHRGQKNLASAVAIALGVSDATLYAWCRELAIEVSDYAHPRAVEGAQIAEQ
jgi:transcriptional regulator with PAS, ATPase and Fis domain